MNLLDMFEEPLENIFQELSLRAKQLTVNSIGRVLDPIPQFNSVIDKISQLETDFYKWLYLEKTFSQSLPVFIPKDDVRRLFRDLQQSEENYLEISNRNSSNGGGDADLPYTQYLNPFDSETILTESHLISTDYLLWNGDNLTSDAGNSEKDLKQKLPQLLMAKLSGEDLLVCGAFTGHTTCFQSYEM